MWELWDVYLLAALAIGLAAGTTIWADRQLKRSKKELDEIMATLDRLQKEQKERDGA